jgi:hypothetical protein
VQQLVKQRVPELVLVLVRPGSLLPPGHVAGCPGLAAQQGGHLLLQQEAVLLRYLDDHSPLRVQVKRARVVRLQRSCCWPPVQGGPPRPTPPLIHCLCCLQQPPPAPAAAAALPLMPLGVMALLLLCQKN